MIETYIENLFQISDIALEILFKFCETEYLSNIIIICHKILKKFLEDNYSYSEFKAVQEDLFLSRVNSIVYNICSFCFEEFYIKYSHEIKEKINNFVASTYSVIEKNQ